ncbi:quercetin dioxygenase-like cupin family protein [Rhodoligotrophos appendicifer]|uniref:hypothetical protein n=1 Tax=Rhodoligotrophos appendicifer TaxID=987056 RepID=UPI00117CAEF7|nr:hypothetical protein [Rhodoligotrophos appendicifer]
MYLATDPRSTLHTKTAAQKPVPAAYHGADCLKFYETGPSEQSDLHQSWLGRGQNFIVDYCVAKDGAVLERRNQADEYMVILPDHSTAVSVSWGDETVALEGYSLTIVPPGDSTIMVQQGGVIVRLFTSQATDLAAACLNRESYSQADPNVPALQAWPDPAEGHRIRSYSLDVPEETGRFGRIWRSSTFMVNIFYPQGPRDITKMSPHHHDDFQQGSLMLEGECIHHLRWPWTPDMTIWKEDEHFVCKSPSLAIIPPPTIHTTQMTGPNNLLIDIFCPPREDFSLKDGWVLNHDDYPMPKDATGGAASG